MSKAATVLIIDDDADIRQLLSILLQAHGYNTIDAADGAQALRQLKRGPRPAVIILDLMMPHMDGEQFITRIRSGRLRQTPIIVMSGHNASTQKAAQLQAACCLIKPVELNDLLEAVRRLAATAPGKSAA